MQLRGKHIDDGLIDEPIVNVEEHRGPVKGKTFAWTGDGNNVLHSMIEASARFDFNVNIAAPEGSEPQPRFVDWARKNGGAVAFKKTAEEANLKVVEQHAVALGDHVLHVVAQPGHGGEEVGHAARVLVLALAPTAQRGRVLVDEVDIGVAVDIGQARALAALHRQRERAVVQGGAGVAAGHDLAGTGEEAGGARSGGYSMYLHGGAAHMAFNLLGEITTVSAPSKAACAAGVRLVTRGSVMCTRIRVWISFS